MKTLDRLFDTVILLVVLSILAALSSVAKAADFTVQHRDVQVAELTWQALNIADWAQTIKGPVRDPRFVEVNSAWALGAKPSAGGVIAFGAAVGVLHYAVSGWLDSNAPRWAARTWEAVTIVGKVDVIRHNYFIGIRL